MNNKIFITTLSAFTLFLVSVFQLNTTQQKEKKQDNSKVKVVNQKENKEKVQTIVKVDTLKSKLKTEIKTADTIKVVENLKFKVYKKQAHASYYHDKFNGRKTASGIRFDNTKYTAAHKKLPFGTIVKVTNETNGKFVIVQITDRGPFSKVREIDLSKKAFMEITSNKNSGVVIVTMEVVGD
jgi:rare lipoprotein A